MLHRIDNAVEVRALRLAISEQRVRAFGDEAPVSDADSEL